jgi:hypothetical protein
MGTVFPAVSINDALTKAKLQGADTDDFMNNVSYIQQNPTAFIYNNLVQQNTQLSRKIIDIHAYNATEDKKAYYQKEQNYYLEMYYNNFLFWCYYGILAVFLTSFYFNYSKNVWLLLFLAAITSTYPFWMIYLERLFLILYRYFVAILLGNPYSLHSQLYVFQTPDGMNIRF